MVRMKKRQFHGSKFKVQSSKFKVQGSKVKVQGSKVKVQGSRFKGQSSRFKVKKDGFTQRSQRTRRKKQLTSNNANGREQRKNNFTAQISTRFPAKTQRVFGRESDEYPVNKKYKIKFWPRITRISANKRSILRES